MEAPGQIGDPCKVASSMYPPFEKRQVILPAVVPPQVVDTLVSWAPSRHIEIRRGI
jgi:hypothetical protein